MRAIIQLRVFVAPSATTDTDNIAASTMDKSHRMVIHSVLHQSETFKLQEDRGLKSISAHEFMEVNILQRADPSVNYSWHNNPLTSSGNYMYHLL
jgi:hypothetical protein